MSIHIPVFLLELVFWDLEAIRWMKTHNHMISNAIFNGFVTYVTNPDQTRFITNYNVSHYQILERNIYIPSMYSMILNVIIFWKICQLAMSNHKTLYFYYKNMSYLPHVHIKWDDLSKSYSSISCIKKILTENCRFISFIL